MLPNAARHDDMLRLFKWRIPEYYNIGVDVADRQSQSADALLTREADGRVVRTSFGDLTRLSNKLANLFAAQGLSPGDRVGVLLSQGVETAVSHIAAFKAGMISVPLFTLFGEEALEYRLASAGARILITNQANLPKIAAIRDKLPDLDVILSIDGPESGVLGFHDFLEAASDSFDPVPTKADDPALIIFTSGTTGPPKGALLPHRVLLGHLPGVEYPQNLFPKAGDRFWTPADWAWIGGLFDVLLPSLHHGIPVVASRARKFDPEDAFKFLKAMEIRNAFMPPTALKLMRQVADPARFGVTMRSIGSGGETLGTELLDWGRSTFGLTINEFYGQTECNLIVGNCSEIADVQQGSMGRAIPGHQVAIIDQNGTPLPNGEAGQIAVQRPDPVMFLRYWNNPEATEKKFIGDWLLTGDLGSRDDAGYFWYVARDDDVITTAGYRVGPGEIEDCLIQHPAVAMAAVIGVPDPIRTQAIKAFIVLVDNQTPSPSLEDELRNFVKTRLAAHEYPRFIAFRKALPMTTTGKIIRRALRDEEQQD